MQPHWRTTFGPWSSGSTLGCPFGAQYWTPVADWWDTSSFGRPVPGTTLINQVSAQWKMEVWIEAQKQLVSRGCVSMNFRGTQRVHPMGFRSSPPHSRTKKGTSWVELCCRRLGSLGSLLPSSLVGPALTMPHFWFCPGVRLPGQQVQGGVGACL